MSKEGATPAYRGYRLQALFAVYKILSNGIENLIYQPEGFEDLAVFKNKNKLTEIIQVKALTSPLQISDFHPKKEDSFFKRALAQLKVNPELKVTVISFGEIGKEIQKDWNNKPSKKNSIISKLKISGFSNDEIDYLINKVEFQKVDEINLRKLIRSALQKSLAGGDEERAFDCLNWWIYQASEDKEFITHKDLIEKLNLIGKYLAEQSAYHQEWHTTIVPIVEENHNQFDASTLRDEFYQGISTKYEHILANVDFKREKWMQEIKESFRKNNVTIIHGNSGQGKSALAYRYIHDNFPEIWRFEVRGIENKKHVWNIATAITGHANALKTPIIIYIDVLPRENTWPELVKALHEIENLKILVTIREEDWKRSSFSGGDFKFNSIFLDFHEEEAQEIYQRIVGSNEIPHFLNFREAWRKFGSSGPLMEFIYLIIQNESLSDKLKQQATRLQDETRLGEIAENEMLLLRLVSVASAYGARISIDKIVKYLQLVEPERTFNLFEREYLLRPSTDGKYLEGLHPIRSEMLSNLLTDSIKYHWLEIAIKCLTLMDEEDIEVFSLTTFIKRNEEKENLLEFLLGFKPKTWAGLGGLLRSLIWLGIEEYITNNCRLIEEAYENFGAGWWLFFDSDIIGLKSRYDISWMDNLSLLPEENKAYIKELEKRREPKKAAFKYAELKLKNIKEFPPIPKSLIDWEGFAEVALWVGWHEIETNIEKWDNESTFINSILKLPIENLCEITLGLSFLWKDKYTSWFKSNEEVLFEKFRQETGTIVIEDDGEAIISHFIVPVNLLTNKNDNLNRNDRQPSLNEEATKKATLLRCLVPNRSFYGSKGYGHKFKSFELPFDDTVQRMPLGNFSLQKPVRWNGIFKNLVDYRFRRNTWKEYADSVCNIRKNILEAFNELDSGLKVYHSDKKYKKIFDQIINPEKWEFNFNETSNPPIFPKTAVDNLGLIGEGMDKSKRDKSKITKFTDTALALWEFDDYLTSYRDWFFSLSLFFSQSKNLLLWNPIIGKNLPDTKIEELLKNLSEDAVDLKKDSRLSTYNFSEFLKSRKRFQITFRKHFSHLCEETELLCIEQGEEILLNNIFPVWYQFAFHPTKVGSKSIIKIKKKKSELVNILIKKLNKKFNKAKVFGEIEVFSEKITLNHENALWIKVDMPHPGHTFAAFEKIVEALVNTLKDIKSNQWKKYVVGETWEHIYIIPLVSGKSLRKEFWKIPLNTFFENEPVSLKNWLYAVPQIFEDETWQLLNMPFVEKDLLQLSNKFQEHYINLWLNVGHLIDFKRLPELKDEEFPLFKEYFLSQGKIINELLQSLLDVITEMAECFNSLNEEEQDLRLNLAFCMSKLNEIKSNFMPCANIEEGTTLNLDGFENWFDKLDGCRGEVELIRMFWAADEIGVPYEEFKLN